MQKWITGILLVLATWAQGQFLELGVGGGAATYLGDLNPGSFFTNTSVGGMAFGRYNWTPFTATTLRLSRAKLQADDSRNPDPQVRERNLSFRSAVWEVSLVQELNAFPFYPKRSDDEVFAPFINLGLSAFYFNPQAFYQGEWVDLQPLGTEGQGVLDGKDPYSRFQLAILAGGGIKLALSPRFNVALTANYRILFTDYLDDVSTIYIAERDLQQNGSLAVALANRTEEYTGIPANDLTGERRGNSNNNDGFMTWGIQFSFAFYGKKAFKEAPPQYKIYRWF